jgi:hypothetical protein
VQRVLHREGEDHADERRRLQLWASMLKRTTILERAAAQARQHGFDLQVEAIVQRDAAPTGVHSTALRVLTPQMVHALLME